jgi:hypothetical protein
VGLPSELVRALEVWPSVPNDVRAKFLLALTECRTTK